MHAPELPRLLGSPAIDKPAAADRHERAGHLRDSREGTCALSTRRVSPFINRRSNAAACIPHDQRMVGLPSHALMNDVNHLRRREHEKRNGR